MDFCLTGRIKDPSEIKELLEEFKDKRQPLDYSRSGALTLFFDSGLLIGLV